MDLGLNNKVILITGGSSGIGRAIAKQYGKEGANVIVTYNQNKDGAIKTADTLEKMGGKASIVHFNLTEPKELGKTVEKIGKDWSTVNVLINNAVVWGTKPGENNRFEDIPSKEWKRLIRGNLEGTYAAIQQVLPLMRKAEWGRIINISSNLAEDGLPGSSAYASAKSGLHGLTKVLANELASDNILTNAVMPGLTLTKRARKHISEDILTDVRKETPTRKLTLPEDVASLVTFLGSKANGHVNGEIIRVTGGI